MCTALTILTLSFWFVLEAGLVIEEAYQLYLTELDVPSDFRISMVVSWFPREEILRKSPRVVATGGLFLAVDRGGGPHHVGPAARRYCSHRHLLSLFFCLNTGIRAVVGFFA